MRYKLFLSLNASISLFLGCLIYFFFRHDIILSNLEESFEIFSTIRQLLYIETDNTWFWSLLKFYIPDLLWAYSLAFCGYIGFRKHTATILLPLISCTFIETAQQLNIMHGTADVLDIAIEVLGILLAIIVINLSDKYPLRKT